MKRSLLVALALMFSLSSQAGIIIGISSFFVGAIATNNDNEALANAGAIGMPVGTLVSLSGIVMAMRSNSVSSTAVFLIFLNEKSDLHEIEKSLVKSFPEINDMSIVADLAHEIRSQVSNVEGLQYIALDEIVVERILERSDLSQAQVSKIVTALK